MFVRDQDRLCAGQSVRAAPDARVDDQSGAAPSRTSRSNLPRVSAIACLLKAMYPRYEGKLRRARAGSASHETGPWRVTWILLMVAQRLPAAIGRDRI